MRYLTLGEVLALHRRILAESGGRPAFVTLARSRLPYPSQGYLSVAKTPTRPSQIRLPRWATRLIRNHGFIDGNKGDHRHAEDSEQAYAFTTPDQLMADFEADVARWNHEHGRT